MFIIISNFPNLLSNSSSNIGLYPYAFIHAQLTVVLVSQYTSAPIPFNIFDKILLTLPNPITKILLPCKVLVDSSIAIWIAPSAVDIVFNTVNSSLFNKSIIFVSLNFWYNSSSILPAIKVFPLMQLATSDISILFLLKGVFIFIPSLESGIELTIMSDFDVTSSILVHFTISLLLRACSSPYVYTSYPSAFNISASFTILKSPPIIEIFFIISLL